MPSKKTRDFKHLAIAMILFCLGMAYFLFVRTIRSTAHRPLPIPRQSNISLIQNWMTIRYLSRTYGVPEKVFSTKLSTNIQTDHNLTLDHLAKKLGETTPTLMGDIQTIITESKR